MWLETKYILLLSNRLLKFKRKSPVLFNFRCPLCGDSERSKTKARGYVYQRSGKFFFSCHNCGVNYPFQKFLKEIDKGLYEMFLLERLDKDCFSVQPIKESLENFVQSKKTLDNSTLSELECIRDLDKTHEARRYVESRKIPERLYGDIYFCSRFRSWVNSQVPGKFELVDSEESRIVFPFFDPAGNMYAFQGRSLDPKNDVRYITIVLDETKPKIWGWNRVDFNKPFPVLEGPIDALFLDNAIATAGGKITSELIKMNANVENAIIVYDNEPRNKDVVSNLWKAVRANYQVVIWPLDNYYKDVNDMVLVGLNPEKIIKERTFRGLQAELEFNRWKH